MTSNQNHTRSGLKSRMSGPITSRQSTDNYKPGIPEIITVTVNLPN